MTSKLTDRAAIAVRYGFPLLALSLVAHWDAATSHAQIFRTSQSVQSGRFIEAPRNVQQQLREAERSLQEKQYSDAVVRLGDMLAKDFGTDVDADLATQDFFLDVDEVGGNEQRVQGSLLSKARQMIGQLPSEAIEIYELRYGPLARKLLSEAAASRDWEQLRTVRRKYFHTLAGYEASLLLAQHEMYLGHPLSASLLLDDVVATRRAVNHLGTGVVVMHAAAGRLAQRDRSGDFTVSGEVTLGGDTVTLPSTEELPSWLDERYATRQSERRTSLQEYPIFGARPDRNGADSGQMPLTNLRWLLDTTASPRQQRAVQNVAEEMSTAGKLPPPSWVPLRVGDQLLMRTTERLVGVDYRTGKRVWNYPWQPTNESFDTDETSLDGIPGDPDSNDLLTQRVWNDVPYGRISSDGERVYILSDLREVEITPYSPINLRGTRPADTGRNTLVALELATEGKLKWRLGVGSDEVSTLSDAFFLGPPLPLDGRLYVMAEIAGDINLCCLNPTTGAELWRQQLVAVESGSIASDPIRRVAGAMPSYHEGILICPTGAGATVAINLADRTLRWGVRYERSMEMSRSVSNRGRSVDTAQLMKRWFSGDAVASGRSVLVTPVESDRLYGFDLLDGSSLFPRKARGYLRYLAGIRDGSFFLVGPNQVKAFDLQDGSVQWTTDREMLVAGQQISGVGVFGPEEYYLPTSAGQILSISLKDGSVLQRRQTNYPLGNLIAVDGEIISQGATSLAVAFGEATLQPLVDRMLEEDPNNFDALVRKSELLIQHGDRNEALELLARARQMQPENDEVRMLSVSAMLGMLRDGKNQDPDLVATLDAIVERPSQRIELLSLRITAALRDEKFEEAIEQLMELSNLVISEPLLEASADQVVNDPARQCTLDSWISARVAELKQATDPSQLAEINRSLRESNAPRVQGSTSLLRRAIRHFDVLEGIEPMRQELALRYQEDGQWLALERLALGSEIPSPEGFRELSLERLKMLAEVYTQNRVSADALLVLQEIASRVEGELDEEMQQLRRQANAQLSEASWPSHVSLEWVSRTRRVRGFMLSQRVAETEILAGRHFEGWRLVSEGSTSPLTLRDPTGMMRRVPMEGIMDDMDKEAKISGGAMVVVMPKGLVGLDLYHVMQNDGEARLWRRSLSGDDEPVAKRRSTMTPFDDQVVRYYINSSTASNPLPEFKLGPVMGDRVLLLQGGDLMAIDLLRAETLWRNSLAPKSGSVLCDGERVAVVSPQTNEVVFFDLRDGRRLKSESWEHGMTWAAMGSHVLSYVEADEPRKYELRLTNPFSGEVLLTHETFGANRSNADTGIPSGYGRVHGGRYLVHLNSSGKTILWDIIRGREIGQPELPQYDDLQGLRVMLLEDQMILLPKRRQTADAIRGGERIQTTDGTYHKAADAVHAVSMEDGSLRWSREFDSPWGCTLTQPAQTPMLVLVRSPYTFATASRRKNMDVLALDVRNGETLHQRDGKPIEASNNTLETRLTVQQGLSRVGVQIGTELLTYTFGDPDTESSETEAYETTEEASGESP